MMPSPCSTVQRTEKGAWRLSRRQRCWLSSSTIADQPMVWGDGGGRGAAASISISSSSRTEAGRAPSPLPPPSSSRVRGLPPLLLLLRLFQAAEHQVYDADRPNRKIKKLNWYNNYMKTWFQAREIKD